MAEFCEQTVGAALLQLVSRAQALVAELLRLSDRVPDELRAPGSSVYAPLIFDFRYFKSVDVYEERVESNAKLAALDDDFREKYTCFLDRIFQLFNGIVNYYLDLGRYLDDLQEGVYIQSTFESVLHNEDGCQLLVEALVLHGVILMLLEHRLPGLLREHLLVSYSRCKGTIDVPNFDIICTLSRRCTQPASSPMLAVTALLQPSPLTVPATMITLQKPEEIFARFPLPRPLIQTVIGRLRTHDLYSQVRHYPSPDHRTTALLAQAANLYVLLYFIPDILHSEAAVMREIVDKFFKVYWVIPIFMGFTVDLLSAWNQFKAARNALASCITPSAVRAIAEGHISKVNKFLSELAGFLSDGVLNHDYVLNKMPLLLSCARNCNVTLRWLLLHQITSSRKLRELVALPKETLLTLLLDTSRLEFELKSVYGDLLNKKEARWVRSKGLAAECMQDLAAFFSGAKVLSKTIRDENLQQWFTQMAFEMSSLDCAVAVSAGRKIQHMIAALEEVEQFHQIEGSLQTKQYLIEARDQLQEMVRTLNVQESALATLSVISDCSYTWGLIGGFTSEIHLQIQKDPFTVSKLQCLFLKLHSVMDIPLLRICQCQSADFDSVSEYYSSELVAYVRKVLEIVPISMFTILNGVIKEQTKSLSGMPGRLEKDALRDYAKLTERYSLAKATHKVAVFTQGIMSMKKTFIGAIELDPRQLLEDGIRKQLAEEISLALENTLLFTGQTEELERNLEELSKSLHTQRQSMEYFQDYVHVHGLRLWQEEYTKIINRYSEQDCIQRMYKKQTRQQAATPADPNRAKADTCIGRVVSKLLSLTNPSRTMYLAPMSGWFNAEGQEVVGLRTFTILQESMGPAGVAALDSLVCLDVANTLQKCIASFNCEMDDKLEDQLRELEASVDPRLAAPSFGINTLTEAFAASPVCASLVDQLAHIGQLQLIRCLFATQLRAAAQLDSGVISFALEGFNGALVSNIRNDHEIVDLSRNGVLAGLKRQLQACGMCSPPKSIYVATKDPPDHLIVLLLLVTITQLKRFVFDKHLGTLVSRTKKSALDFFPLLVGISTLLQQFHSSHTTSYIQCLRKWIDDGSNKTEAQVMNIIKWILEFGKCSEQLLSPTLVESFLLVKT